MSSQQVVLDASVLLAYLQGEAGAAEAKALLTDGAVCSVANWSETKQKVLTRASSWARSAALLLDYGIRLEPVDREDSERAADLWVAGRHLSLGDRLCLALGDRLDAVVWTADRAWGTEGRIRQLRQ